MDVSINSFALNEAAKDTPNFIERIKQITFKVIKKISEVFDKLINIITNVSTKMKEDMLCKAVKDVINDRDKFDSIKNVKVHIKLFNPEVVDVNNMVDRSKKVCELYDIITDVIFDIKNIPSANNKKSGDELCEKITKWADEALGIKIDLKTMDLGHVGNAIKDRDRDHVYKSKAEVKKEKEMEKNPWEFIFNFDFSEMFHDKEYPIGELLRLPYIKDFITDSSLTSKLLLSFKNAKSAEARCSKAMRKVFPEFVMKYRNELQYAEGDSKMANMANAGGLYQKKRDWSSLSTTFISIYHILYSLLYDGYEIIITSYYKSLFRIRTIIINQAKLAYGGKLSKPKNPLGDSGVFGHTDDKYINTPYGSK